MINNSQSQIARNLVHVSARVDESWRTTRSNCFLNVPRPRGRPGSSALVLNASAEMNSPRRLTASAVEEIDILTRSKSDVPAERTCPAETTWHQ